MSKLDKDESNASHNKEVWCATIIDIKKIERFTTFMSTMDSGNGVKKRKVLKTRKIKTG